MQRANSGRWLLSGVAVATMAGGYAADWNRTHLFNPRWPHPPTLLEGFRG